MNKFIKENWFRLSIIVCIIFFITISCILSPEFRVKQVVHGQITSTIQSNSVDINDAAFLQALIGQLINSNLGYLGIAVTILAIMGGAFVYFNIIPIKEKMEKQEKIINDLLDDSKNETELTLKKFKEDQGNLILTTLAQQKENTNLDVGSKIQNSEKNILEKIEIISENKDLKSKEIILSEVNNRLSTLEASLKSVIQLIANDVSKLEKRISELDFKVKDVTLDIQDFNYKKYLEKGQIGALRALINKLDLHIDLKYNWNQKDILLEIKEYIEKESMPDLYLDDLEKVINKILPEYDELGKEILKLSKEKSYKVNKS